MTNHLDEAGFSFVRAWSGEHLDAAAWRKNFLLMSLAFGVCQATVTTPVGFATSVLDPKVGQIGTGIFMLCSMLSSLLLGAPVVTALGSKTSLLIGMSLSTVYAFCFSVATLQVPGSNYQWIIYLLGSISMGAGSGILWTAQGTFFGDSSTLVADQEGSPKDSVTASLGGRFAAVLLATEIVMKLGVSLSQGSLLQWKFSEPLVSLSATFFIYSFGAACMVFVMSTVAQPSRRETHDTTAEYYNRLKVTFQLCRSPKIWCLGLTNLTFGFSAGYMNGYVNSAFVHGGAGGIGTLLAITSFVAATASTFFGRLAQKVGKGVVIALGAFAFASIPLSILLVPPSAANDYWGSWLVMLYVLQGLGRAVYESTNKGVFADFFPGKQSAGAFANCMMQNAFAFFMSFLLQSVLEDKSVLAWIVLVLSVLTVPGFLVSSAIHKKTSVASVGAATV